MGGCTVRRERPWHPSRSAPRGVGVLMVGQFDVPSVAAVPAAVGDDVSGPEPVWGRVRQQPAGTAAVGAVERRGGQVAHSQHLPIQPQTSQRPWAPSGRSTALQHEGQVSPAWFPQTGTWSCVRPSRGGIRPLRGSWIAPTRQATGSGVRSLAMKTAPATQGWPAPWEGSVAAYRSPSWLEHAGHAPQPWLSRTRSAMTISCSRVAS